MDQNFSSLNYVEVISATYKNHIDVSIRGPGVICLV